MGQRGEKTKYSKAGITDEPVNGVNERKENNRKEA